MSRHKNARTPYRYDNGSYHTVPQHAKQRTTGGIVGPGPQNLGRGNLGQGLTYAPGGKGVVPTAQAAAAAPPVQPLDPAVVNQQVIANRDIGTGDLYATWQQGNLDQQYGFGAGGAANPYSQAALLQENYKRSQLGTTNNMASAGQLYSGAYGRAQNEVTRNYDIGYDQLRRGYDQATGNIQFDRLQRYANAGTGIDDSKFQALLKALGGL